MALYTVAGLLVIVFGIVAASLLFPGIDDPKDIRYRAWKVGLYRLDSDQALGTMVGDPQRNELVLGKTKEQLIRKFGYVSSSEEATDYVRHCYADNPYSGKQVLVLRNSNWMVVMQNGVAADLLRVKGC
ncbi:MAG TPA: hypothetical protein VMD92_11185 [Acidobacteriaceae bacterium]|nr:hypothetical protein [Acidobacteriaceae bacterium]